MDNDIVGALLAFVLGVLISFGNFKLSEYFLKTRPEKFSSVSMIRQLVQVLYIVILFFTAKYLPWDRTYLLIGAALGVTLPMFLFTLKLLRVNKNGNSEKTEKEESDNG